ncbi:MAG: GSCFA domain-containing protein [Prevotella sp.]|nr:GSCFA domain-containing protein [Prevotella sp.]
MEFSTKVDIGQAPFTIQPCEQVLLVGSCFAGEMGQRFGDNGFPTTVNPFGTMYNPASILHTLQRLYTAEAVAGQHAVHKPGVVFLTLGTNHVYRLKETGEIVDNCAKRPAALFQEEELTVGQCADYLSHAIELLYSLFPDVQVVLTVSPIRYRKYGYHGSQLSKATLLLAVEEVSRRFTEAGSQPSAPNRRQPLYFPAYELFMDELRDYRFYASDMLHPSEQAVDYGWERLVGWCFSPAAIAFMDEWRPIRQALNHRPFNSDSEEYRRFQQQTKEKLEAFQKKYPQLCI